MSLTRQQKSTLAHVTSNAATGRVGSVFAGELASVVPWKGSSIVIDETHYAATRTRPAYLAAIAQLDKAAGSATTDAQKTAILSVATALEAAKSVREAVSDPATAAQVNAAAKAGNADAVAVLQAASVAKTSDMKATAVEVATGMQAGDQSAVSMAQKIVEAADSPGPLQGDAKALAGMIGDCCDACCMLTSRTPLGPYTGVKDPSRPFNPPSGKPPATRQPHFTPTPGYPQTPGTPGGLRPFMPPALPSAVPPPATTAPNGSRPQFNPGALFTPRFPPTGNPSSTDLNALVK